MFSQRGCLACHEHGEFPGAKADFGPNLSNVHEKIKPGDLIHAVRVAVTGKSTGPGLFECLGLLGRQRSLNRIDRALERPRT